MSSSAFFAARAALGPAGPCPHGSPADRASVIGNTPRQHEQAAAATRSAVGQAVPQVAAPPAFPATRAHLWDRTAAGAVTVIDLKVGASWELCI